MQARLYYRGTIRSYQVERLSSNASGTGEELVLALGGRRGELVLMLRNRNRTYETPPIPVTADERPDEEIGKAWEQLRLNSAAIIARVMMSMDTEFSGSISEFCELAHVQQGLLRLDLDGETLWEHVDEAEGPFPY